MIAARRILVTGASGSDTSTLGRALALALDRPHHDIDRYFWLPSFPPFRDERPVARLRARELAWFGADMVGPGGVMHEEHEAFVEWAAAYDRGTREGRNRPRHEAWRAALPCPVLRLDGGEPVKRPVGRVRCGLVRSTNC